MRINPVTGMEEEDELASIIGQFDTDRAAALEDANSYDLGGRTGAALSAIGAGFMGKDPGAAANAVLTRNQGAKDAKVAALDKWKQGKIDELRSKRDFAKSDMDLAKGQREAGLAMASDDAASADSTAYAQQISTLFPAMKGVVAGKSKTQLAEMMPLLTEKLRGERERANATTAKEYREQVRMDDLARKDEERGRKLEEERQGRMTTFGEARTPDDAKKLKDASTEKTKFDNALTEMITLRKKHGGGSLLNREDVARGKQLSRDLLLAKKNMESLGVLSKSDEAIINAIIPEDPLAFDFVPGQDPILSNMEKFQKDSETNFQSGLKQRLRETQNTVKVIGPDGKTREIPRNQLEAAIKSGGRVAESTAAR